MDLRGERVLALFLLLAMFYVLLFISFTIFFHGFFLYSKGTHTKEEKFYSHLPGVVDCGVFHGS